MNTDLNMHIDITIKTNFIYSFLSIYFSNIACFLSSSFFPFVVVVLLINGLLGKGSKKEFLNNKYM